MPSKILVKLDLQCIGRAVIPVSPQRPNRRRLLQDAVCFCITTRAARWSESVRVDPDDDFEMSSAAIVATQWAHSSQLVRTDPPRSSRAASVRLRPFAPSPDARMVLESHIVRAALVRSVVKPAAGHGSVHAC
jgi:hypothetical protein